MDEKILICIIIGVVLLVIVGIAVYIRKKDTYISSPTLPTLPPGMQTQVNTILSMPPTLKKDVDTSVSSYITQNNMLMSSIINAQKALLENYNTQNNITYQDALNPIFAYLQHQNYYVGLLLNYYIAVASDNKHCDETPQAIYTLFPKTGALIKNIC
jgi:hypothetical protein